MLKLGLVGYSGRMGQLIFEAALESDEVEIASIYTRTGTERLSGVHIASDWGDLLTHCDVVIDFSNPSGTRDLVRSSRLLPKPLVIGTTGLDQETLEMMRELSQQIPIVYATNTSQGVNILNHLASLVASLLPDSDIEIVEMHHHHKKDSPSGTAMTLAQCCADARQVKLEHARVSGRDGNIGERKKGEIGVMSLRGGDIVGRHTVGFYCDGEYLELTHNATSRKTFALGAIRAAQWVCDKSVGLYSMRDVLTS
ncbi:4-hydroxy-tetrahydrodipicolinate reductase [Helicobacter pametensis]|uniref:4-hydroxy-tetrahydrodipicolinate reductase n=1 Tax=Helicobacter pametensis TaxID=95149 RepID=UPI00048884A5|nr:4-hydroxy-tetrahydrodipicolinate reductase [Helicobacter pametensis]